jgi:hypothetical protein
MGASSAVVGFEVRGLDPPVSPVWNREEGSRSETGGLWPRQIPALPHYVRLPPIP